MTDTPDTPVINWGYNCLTDGIHHGRPEAIWNIPLPQALVMFGLGGRSGLERLVVTRIYVDSMQFVKHGIEPRKPEAWARQMRDLAKAKFPKLFVAKTNEIHEYYNSDRFARDIDNAIGRFEDNKLHANYNPLHGHDSINMLCRILGSSCAREIGVEEVSS